MTRPQARQTRALVLVLALLCALSAIVSAGCTQPDCPDAESFVVNENGTCSAAPLQFTLVGANCRVSIENPGGMTGLPMRGAMAQHPVPLRQGDFMLYDDQPSFRLCRARRVNYWLELSCVDGAGDAVCQATVTEPAL